MSDSDMSYSEIDLDNLRAPTQEPDDKVPASDIEIVDDVVDPAPAAEPEQPRAKPEPQNIEDDDDEEDEAPTEVRRKLTRSQRLKAQRDAYAAKLAEQEAELTALREKATKFETNAGEAANISLDLYIKTLDDGMKMLRQDFDKALASGDSEALWEVQTKMMDLAATKKEAEREKRSIPPKAAPKSESGPEARQPTPTTTTAPATSGTGPRNLPPLVASWAERNKSWFNVDKAMTAVAAVVDRELLDDGYTIDNPEFFVKFDERMRANFPHKFTGDAEPRASRGSPTVQQRAPVVASGGKVRVVITAEDRATADHLGIKIEDYAREKAKRERAVNTPNQYTEIL
jgi:hypothetical protein